MFCYNLIINRINKSFGIGRQILERKIFYIEIFNFNFNFLIIFKFLQKFFVKIIFYNFLLLNC